MNLTDLAIVSNVPLPPAEPKRGRGRPKGSLNKKTIQTSSKSEFKRLSTLGADVLPPIDSKKIEVAVMDDLVKKKRGRPKRGEEYTIIGSLNKVVAAVEFEEVKETSEQKAHTKEQLKEVDEMRKQCGLCGHSRTAHKHSGPCMIQNCECENYE